jgi:hypothetical protein
MRKLIGILGVLLLATVGVALAADTVLTWPKDGNDKLVRFTVGKLRQVSSVSGQSDYLGEALAENLSDKAIPSASFYLYVLDKNGKRVGEGYLEVTNLAAGQKAKVPVSVHAIGSFASMELQPQHLPSDEPVKIKMHISSVPAGASVKVDSEDSGVTPEVLPITVGTHTLVFSKEGYATASTPVEVAESSLPDGVSIDLNPLTLDTVILRDGTVLIGTLTSVSSTGVNLSVKGRITTLSRSRVARIVLGQGKTSGSKQAASKSSTHSN